MIYRNFKDNKLSLLGFGAMRLPLNADGSVDETTTTKMVELSIEKGVNFFDTAYPYHSGESERIMGEILEKYPRDSYYLATKYPGHQITKPNDPNYDPAAVFEEQLKKCRVDYFDFYLMHNVYENSIQEYTDPDWGIMDYFIEQKRLGKIKYLGFSTHGGLEVMEQFIDLYGEHLDFCQIQLNYLDWTLQNAKAKYEMLTQRGIPVWVMEPVRGGKLAKLDNESEALLKEFRPDSSIASWSLRFLQQLPNVTMILSGMSDMAQVQDNLNTFASEKPLTEVEQNTLLEIAEKMKNAIPCTSCRYCTDSCPAGLDIPFLLNMFNEVRVVPSVNSYMRLDALGEDKQASACINCGKCLKMCPQNIDIPAKMIEFTELLTKLPTWESICRQRDESQIKA